MRPIPNAADRLKETYAVLVEDCQEAEHQLRESDSPFHRRMFVRVLSSFVEGMGHQMRCVVREGLEYIKLLDMCHLAKDKWGFEEWEVAWLYEKKPISNKSVPKKHRGKIFRIAMVCYAKLYMENCEWTCLDKLDRVAKIRDRITHPRSAAKLEVSDDDRNEALAAAESLIEDMAKLFSVCNSKT